MRSSAAATTACLVFVLGILADPVGVVLAQSETRALLRRLIEVGKLQDDKSAEIDELIDGECSCGVPSHDECETPVECWKDERDNYNQLLREYDAAQSERLLIAYYLESPQETGRRINELLQSQIDSRDGRIEELQGRKADNARLQRKLIADKLWKEELDFWVQESQKAQRDAIIKTVENLAGIALDEILADRKELAEQFLEQYKEQRPARRHVLRLLKGVKLPEDAVETRKTLKRIETLLDQSVEHNSVAEALEFVKTSNKELRDLMTRLDTDAKVMDAVAMNDLNKAIEIMSKATYDQILDAGLDKAVAAWEHRRKYLIKDGWIKNVRTGQVVSVAQWVVEYSYQSFRFRTAWKQVDEMLPHIDQRLRAMNTLANQMKETQDEITRLRGRADAIRKTQQSGSALQRMQELTALRTEWLLESQEHFELPASVHPF